MKVFNMLTEFLYHSQYRGNADTVAAIMNTINKKIMEENKTDHDNGFGLQPKVTKSCTCRNSFYLRKGTATFVVKCNKMTY